jgi:peptidoglycan-N-acetylmuramic acid deacetylase
MKTSMSTRVLSLLTLACTALLTTAFAAAPPASITRMPACDKPVYLTIDTGHMGIAPLVAEVLAKHRVKATFFLASEPTQAVAGRHEGFALDDQWAAWWRTLAKQGHDFGSHTWDHIVWQRDAGDGFHVTATAGPTKGKAQVLSRGQYCEQLAGPARRFKQMTGQPMRAVFRAPGGKTSPALLAAAKACGWTHVPWSASGFLGDELPSDRYPNQALLDQALKNVRSGDILLMHLGIWSRREPWAPAVLEPLIVGLKARGLCFMTLREHPDYRRVGSAPVNELP